MASAGSAKAALSCACHVFAAHGIHLEAEAVRQAKFNAPGVTRSLCRALHDLVLLQLLWDSGVSEGQALRPAADVWRDVEQEGLSGVPVEGLVLICYYLYQWNCPSSIVQALETGAAAAAAAAASHASGDNQPLSSDDAGDACHHVGSRTLLLALAWLMGHCRLFERVVEEQLAPVGTHAMLPPWPRDSALCAATHDTYWQAVQQQQAQVQGILQACHNNTSGEPPQPGLGPFDDSPAWAGVEAASHSAVMLLGKARAQLSALQSLLDCRARLQQAIRQAQSGSGQQRGQAQEGAGGSGASWELSPFEAHLLCNGKVLEAHAQALEAAAAALTQQQELATNARLFYSWMASVVGEDAKAQGLESWAAGKGAGSAASPAGSAATQLGTASMLHSLQRLPDCGSAAAAGLLQHLDQQLQAAVEATAAWLSAARTSERLSVYTKPTGPAKAGQEDLSLRHFQLLASKAMAAPAPAPTSAATKGRSGTAAASSTGTAGGQAPSWALRADWRLPGDVAQTVRSAVPPTPSSSTPQGTGGARGTPSATPGTPVTPGTNPTAVNAHAADGSLPALSQEGAQRLVACVHRAACLRLDLTPASTLAQPQGSTAGHRAALQAQAMGPEAVDGQEEADRLLRVTLQCGKVLAQARAANKQALLRCLDQLPPEIKAGWPT